MVWAGASTEAAAADNCGGKCQVLPTPHGDKVLPFRELPADTSFKGIPKDGEGTDAIAWKEALAKNNAAGSDPLDYIKNKLFPRLRSQVPDLISENSAKNPNNLDIVVHSDWNDPSLYFRAGKGGLHDYCAEDENRCGFVGNLVQVAPYLERGIMVQGPKTVKLAKSVTTTDTRTTTRGWSAGGSIIVMPPGSENMVSFQYTTSTSDAHAFGKTSSAEVTSTVPAGHWGYSDLRFTGGQYTGFLVVRTPQGALDFKPKTRHKGIPEYPSEVKALKNAGVRMGEDFNHAYNTREVVEVYPVRTLVKAPGPDGELPPSFTLDVTWRDGNASDVVKALWAKRDELTAKWQKTKGEEKDRLLEQLQELDKKIAEQLKTEGLGGGMYSSVRPVK
ncbi:hypothetical protein ACFP1Z_19275 [Streptomyces gamaensis]|uniref:Secreted protein n=1 Tax=Streptomyces gamaensis TaxID=1763542 RepID=A0ABW0Z4S3_9ACTN